jgi:hypothetical protein
MRTGFTTAVPHTDVEVSTEERAEARRRYALLNEIEKALRAGDYETVKALASEL